MILSTTRRFEADMEAADSYAEWKKAAQAHDQASGMDRWKKTDESPLFDHASIRSRLRRLRTLRRKQDHAGLLFALNEGVHGNIDGIGRAELYSRARFGTKKLIVDYINEVATALELLAGPDADDVPYQERLDFFRRARHCYGRTALMMSGAGSLLFFHVGVVMALWRERVLPDVLSGSSGGAIVGCLVSTHGDEELEEIFDPENLVHEIERDEGLLEYLSSLKPELVKSDEVRAIIERLIPDLTFQEAFARTRRHLNVSIASAEQHQTSRLLNAITTPNVFVREALLASAAVPGFFPPVRLAAKNDRGERQPYLPARRWVDGSLSDDLPAKRLGRLYGVNHFVVSQVNPHIFPFVTDTSADKGWLATLAIAGKRTAREWINAGASVMQKPLSWNPTISRITNVALGIINQDYVGDINILPDSRFFNPLKLLSHRSVDEVVELIRMGERATWPKIEMIRTQTRISRVLTRILREFDDARPPVQQVSARRAG